MSTYDPIPLHIAITYQPHINTNTMPNSYDHAGNLRYDEAADVYTTPTDAERIAWLEGQVKQLWHMVGAVNYPNQRNSGGAVDSEAIVMGGK